MPWSPMDWPGAPFLMLYLALLIVAGLFSGLASALLRPEGREQEVADAGWLARLTGGRTRWLDATVAGRLVNGELSMIGRDRFAAATGSHRGWKKLSRDLAAPAERTERELRKAGLLASEDEGRSLSRWAAGPFLALAAFGAAKLVIGLGRDRPVGFLLVLLIVTLIAALIRWNSVDQRTRAGLAAVRRARAAKDRLRRAPTRPEMELGVALYGTGVLAASEYAPFHQRRAGNGDGGSGGGDTSGDGGCGGGGCGGCGGGGD